MVINEFEKQSDHPCDNDKSRFGTYLPKNKMRVETPAHNFGLGHKTTINN